MCPGVETFGVEMTFFLFIRAVLTSHFALLFTDGFPF